MSNETILAIYYDKGDKVEITVETYVQYIRTKDKDKIADFIYHRLYSRYIKPFEYDDNKYKKEYKNGFSMMANCCLLIETFQTFVEGEKTSKGKSEKMFQTFFDNNNTFSSFKKKEKIENDRYQNSFYRHVRCGILHQGETTGGWKINRKKNTLLFDNKNINANKFREELKTVLEEYNTKLKSEAFDSKIWVNFRTKMNEIIENCQ
jgi:hypothetical protein